MMYVHVARNCLHEHGFKLINIADESMQVTYVKFVQLVLLLQFRIIDNIAILLIQLNL